MKLMILKVCAVIAFVLNLQATTCDKNCEGISYLKDQYAEDLLKDVVAKLPQHDQDVFKKYFKHVRPQELLKKLCEDGYSIYP